MEASVINFRDDYVIEWKDAEFERVTVRLVRLVKCFRSSNVFILPVLPYSVPSASRNIRGLRKLSSVGISGVGYVDLNALLNLEHLKTMHISSGEDTDYSLLTKFNLDYLEISCNEEIFQTVNIEMGEISLILL